MWPWDICLDPQASASTSMEWECHRYGEFKKPHVYAPLKGPARLSALITKHTSAEHPGGAHQSARAAITKHRRRGRGGAANNKHYFSQFGKLEACEQGRQGSFLPLLGGYMTVFSLRPPTVVPLCMSASRCPLMMTPATVD